MMPKNGRTHFRRPSRLKHHNQHVPNCCFDFPLIKIKIRTGITLLIIKTAIFLNNLFTQSQNVLKIFSFFFKMILVCGVVSFNFIKCCDMIAIHVFFFCKVVFHFLFFTNISSYISKLIRKSFKLWIFFLLF